MGRHVRTLIVAVVVVLAAGIAAANAPPPASGTTTSPAVPAADTIASAAAPAIERIVSVTRTVEAGAAPVSAFVVPADRRLVVTDVLVTNPGPTPACGASIGPDGTPATPAGTPGEPGPATGDGATGRAGATPADAGTTPATVTGGESGTGPLCVPAQTTLNLGLTTGLELAAGQSVRLANTPPAAPATPGGPLHYHLRGFLVTTTGP